jgi:hypothetical protein
MKNRILGQSFLQQYKINAKALGPKIRDASARFDPNAVDGDDDGKVQDGTRFERPALERAAAKMRRGISGSMSQGMNPTTPAATNSPEIKEFDGMDYDSLVKVYEKITSDMRAKYGDLNTVDDALQALKKVFKKVSLRHFGQEQNYTDQEGRSNLSDTLSQSEQGAIYAILHTLQEAPHLKKRRAFIQMELDDGSFSANGSTAVMPRIDLRDGTQKYPEFGLTISVPANMNALAQFVLSEESDNFFDGVAPQVAKQILKKASEAPDAETQQQIYAGAIIMMSMAVSTHESIHALVMPQVAEELIAKLKKRSPNATGDADLLEQLEKDSYGPDELFKVANMRDIIDDMESSIIGNLIRPAMAYEIFGPEKYLEGVSGQTAGLEIVRDRFVAEKSQVQDLVDDGSIPMLQGMLIIAQMDNQIDQLNEKLTEAQAQVNDLETNINAGTPEKSEIAKIHKFIYGDGLNYFYDIFPPGHPGHGKDVVMTVDEMGNEVPFIDSNGQMVKDRQASPEAMESLLLSFMDSQNLSDYLDNNNISVNSASLALFTPGYSTVDANGNKRFDVSQTLNALDQDVLDTYLRIQRQGLFFSKTTDMWPDFISDSIKWKLLNWMRQVSDYGSAPHEKYRNGLTFASQNSINSAEIYPELVSSLIFGAGAANVPMPADVRSAVVDILNWIYGGDGWKSLMPPISLEALGV